MRGIECQKVGMFGTGRVGQQLRKAWCSTCEAPVLTRCVGLVNCAECRRTKSARQRWAALLEFYWIKLGYV